MDIVDIAATAFLFFVAGFETAATPMSLVAYEFPVNPKIEEKLQAEIYTTSKATNAKDSYKANSNMPYLDSVFQ